jgi:hypothetical protein
MLDSFNLILTLKKTFLFSLLLLVACNKISTGDTLSKTDIELIQKLKLLDKNEKIYKFYSEFKNEVAGKFFTNKRIAKYWIDAKDKAKDVTAFAFYQDIKSIDTVYNAGATYCPYMLITKTDNKQFKVCVDGKREEIKDFFEEALNVWTRVKNAK